jgi:hypothetical protein
MEVAATRFVAVPENERTEPVRFVHGAHVVPKSVEEKAPLPDDPANNLVPTA